MPNKSEAPSWIRDLFEDKLDAAGGFFFTLYHEAVLHQAEIENPNIRAIEQLKEEVPISVREKLDKAHAALNPHQFNP